MDGWMLVSPSVGEERRGIDRADERRGRGTGRVGMQWVGGHEEGESWGEKERGRGRSGGHSLQCVHPLHSPPSLTHSLSADIKEMGVSKGGWSASETRLVVSHETTLLPAPRRQELQTATGGFTSTSSLNLPLHTSIDWARLRPVSIPTGRRALSYFELKRFYGESAPVADAAASPRANCQVFKGVVAV